MLGFARNIVFLRVNGGSVAEKSWLAVKCFGPARAMELMVPGDFFFDDAVLLCFACVETLCALELLH